MPQAVSQRREKTFKAARPRVLLADDHRMLREVFAQILEADCDVVGAVGDGRALLSAAPELKPDVVVLDIGMPLLNGLDAARQLKRTMPEIKIVVLTVNEDPDLAADAIRAGASCYLLKNSAASELLQAIDEAMRGRSYITPLVAKGLVDALARGPGEAAEPALSSPRRREVLQLLAEGRTMKEIARILKITPRTVAFHKYGMMKQLGVRSTAELVKAALKLGVVSA
jgi:DNA-binding NarL/FixJ family response regulator